jgi:hypothetical protein
VIGDGTCILDSANAVDVGLGLELGFDLSFGLCADHCCCVVFGVEDTMLHFGWVCAFDVRTT